MSITKKFDVIVFIGRFAPFHIGHQSVIQTALTKADKVIVLVGSSYRPRTVKNPWSFHERVEMISSTLSENDNVSILPLKDFMYDDSAWTLQVQTVVNTEVYSKSWLHGDPKIGIIGHEKDDSSFYLKLFPQWEHIEHKMNEVVHATDIRNLLLQQKNFLYLKGLLPSPVFDIIKDFTYTKDFKDLITEFNFIEVYKDSWKAAPYPPVFVTADAVVIQSGHVLLIVRDAAPGSGLLAIPGGFINQSEYVEDAALRELKEETKIDVPLKVLRGNIKNSHVFDNPNRSLRGRTITHAFFIELMPGVLPKVKGGDDARHAQWVPFNELNSSNMFEDHFDILQFFIG